jgi:hypothetical protein
MTPDFDELVGDEGSSADRESLRQIHDLLVSASPPPPGPAWRAPRVSALVSRSRAVAALGLATTVSVVVGLGIGYTVGHGARFHTDFSRPMHGIGPAREARALIEVGGEDANGNRALEMTIRSLPALPHKGLYELYLSKHGKPILPCGTFQTGSSGSAEVSLNVPGSLAEYDGWIITALTRGPRARVLLTT